MHDYLLMIIKSIIVFITLIIVMRIMGKREVGELSIFDIVVFFIISELFSFTISDPESSIFKSIVPIVTIVILQVFLSYIVLKVPSFRRLIDGKPSIIIENGVINQKEMKKNRYNLDDLYTQMRMSDVSSLQDIKFAILETSGDLSIIKNTEEIAWPYPVIQDGKINEKALKMNRKTKDWLDTFLRNKNIKCEDIFLAYFDQNELILIKKELL